MCDKIKIFLGDCEKILKDIPSNSIDMVLCDPPYGTMATISQSNSGGFKNADYTWDIGLNWGIVWSELLKFILIMGIKYWILQWGAVALGLLVNY